MYTHIQASEATRLESTEDQIIVATEVDKSYRTGAGRVHALRSVSLTVKRGEMIAIMGPSGCGKTTLLNCLSGLDDFESGEVLIEGQSLRRMGDRKRTDYRARRMGFIFQSYNLLPVLTAAENVELPLLVTGVNAGQARERALNALDSVGLSDRAGHRPAELSGGQRQRVTIARALANDPAIIWADEPTGNLDSKTAADILNMMHDLNREFDQTFVIVTHDPEVGQQCDRIIHMSDGEIVRNEVLELDGIRVVSTEANSTEVNSAEANSEQLAEDSAVDENVWVPVQESERQPYAVAVENEQALRPDSETGTDENDEKENDGAPRSGSMTETEADDASDGSGSWLTRGY